MLAAIHRKIDSERVKAGSILPVSDVPNFHIHVSVIDLYIPKIGPHIFLQEKANRSWEYINRSQAHECGNWDCGRAIPFLGIFVSNFRYIVSLQCAA
jgi:hypothetical protein